MTRHYPDVGSASDWLCRKGIFFQQIKSTTKIWVFCEGSSGVLAEHQLFPQATNFAPKPFLSLLTVRMSLRSVLSFPTSFDSVAASELTGGTLVLKNIKT